MSWEGTRGGAWSLRDRERQAWGGDRGGGAGVGVAGHSTGLGPYSGCGRRPLHGFSATRDVMSLMFHRTVLCVGRSVDQQWRAGSGPQGTGQEPVPPNGAKDASGRGGEGPWWQRSSAVGGRGGHSDRWPGFSDSGTGRGLGQSPAYRFCSV